MKLLRTLCGLLAITAVSPVLAWHDAGHMAIALIAYNDLGSGAKSVADILRKHPDYAEWMKKKPASVDEDRWLFMRASVWPDDIRDTKHPSHKYHQGTWHYAARFHANPAGFTLPDNEPGDHIEEAFPKLTAILKGNAPQEEKARAICWLFHLVGDIHMPLHAGSFVSSTWPKGDRGGNEFWVKVDGSAIRLHTFWDGLFSRETALDSSANKKSLWPADVDFAKVEKLAESLSKQFERTALSETRVKDFGFWVESSNRLAIKFAYLDYKLAGGATAADAGEPPASYAGDARKLAGQRAAVAGYRLADVMRATAP